MPILSETKQSVGQTKLALFYFVVPQRALDQIAEQEAKSALVQGVPKHSARSDDLRSLKRLLSLAGVSATNEC
jgi:hypothetical protein